MPNWCSNSVTVSHEDPAMMAKFAAAVKEGNLFETFLPMPSELDATVSPSEPDAALIEKYGASDWYTWNLNNWGTKWDVSEGDFELDGEGNCGSGWFDTAWGPPLEAYRNLKEMGFVISATYNEPGMGFCGMWDDGVEEYIDNYYDLFEREDFDLADLDYDPDVKYMLENEYESWLQYREDEENAADSSN